MVALLDCFVVIWAVCWRNLTSWQDLYTCGYLVEIPSNNRICDSYALLNEVHTAIVDDFWSWLAIWVAQYAKANALNILGDAPIGKQLFAFGGVENFLGAMNPATANTKAICRVHQVGQCYATIVHVGVGNFGCKHNDDVLCAVKWISFGAHNVGIELG